MGQVDPERIAGMIARLLAAETAEVYYPNVGFDAVANGRIINRRA